MTRRRRQLMKGPCRLGIRDQPVLASPPSTIVDIDNPARAANGNPSIPSQDPVSPACAPQCQDCGSHRALIYPSTNDPLLPPVPLQNFAVFADNSHAVPVSPPREICNSASAFDSSLRYPLTRPCIQHVHYSAPLASASYKSHPTPAWTQFESFHAFLLILVAIDTCYLFHFPRLQVPDMKVPAAAREEDARAGRWMECCCIKGRRAKVKSCEKRVGGRGYRRDMMEVQSRGGTGGEQKRVGRMK